MTTRGMQEPEMREIADIIGEALPDIGKNLRADALRARVFELTGAFGVP